MTVEYRVPDKPRDRKLRFIEVTNSYEKEAVERAGLRDPIGTFDKDGRCWAEAHSLAQFRGQLVEFEV